jgi:tripartite-type tricarboxylate transporter receptor subunit TctC
MQKRRFKGLAIGSILTLASLSIQAADNWPDKPIHLVVGFAPGGGVDIMARIIQKPLSDKLGQPVIVDNLPGAGGNIAAAKVAHAAKDGNTLLVSVISSMAISASLYKNLEYNLDRDLTPVGVIASVPNVLVVHPSVPATSVKELIALAKAQPNKLSYGSAGTGTTVHFTGELFASMADVKMTHIPYKGAAPAMNDLLGGQVQLMFDFLSAAAPQIKAGKLRALAVTSKTRSPLLPQVPTVAEAGVPGYEALASFGVFAPMGTPEAVIERVNREIAAIVARPEIVQKLAVVAATPDAHTVTESRAVLKSEIGKWGDLVKKTGVTLD